MRDLTVRLDALDPEAGAALRVIAYFDDLVANEAGLQAIVRGAAVLAACPAALVDPSHHVRVRVGADGAAGTPGPRDPSWPGVAVGTGNGELWLERQGAGHPIDAMVLERAAAAVGSVVQRTRHRTDGHAQDQACVEILLDPGSSPTERMTAARRLQLPSTGRVRAVAVDRGRVLIVPADRPEPPVGRAGLGPAAGLDDLPQSAVAARLAWRLTAEGQRRIPGRVWCMPTTSAACWSWPRRSARRARGTPMCRRSSGPGPRRRGC
ncbi:MAG TPA: hypothetical protein VIU11_21150 [Nakamurella sp.]